MCLPSDQLWVGMGLCQQVGVFWENIVLFHIFHPDAGKQAPQYSLKGACVPLRCAAFTKTVFVVAMFHSVMNAFLLTNLIVYGTLHLLLNLFLGILVVRKEFKSIALTLPDASASLRTTKTPGFKVILVG